MYSLHLYKKIVPDTKDRIWVLERVGLLKRSGEGFVSDRYIEEDIELLLKRFEYMVRVLGTDL